MRGQFTNAKIVGVGIDSKEYHKQVVERGHPEYVMSRSELMLFSLSPSRWVRGYRQEDTDATQYGSLLDCLVTDASRFDERYCIKPETYVNDKGEEKPWNANSNVCKEWLADHKDQTALSLEDKCDADKAVSRLHRDPEIYEFLSCCEFQVMVTADYTDAETGVIVPVKTLPDCVPDSTHPLYGKCLCNFKTARDASPDKWEREIFTRHYHTSAAMELDVYSAARPDEDRCEYRHIISESVFPYEPGRRWIDSEFIELGRLNYRTALANYARCLKSQKWPGWDDGDGGLIKGWTQMAMQPWMVKQVTVQLAMWQSNQEIAAPVDKPMNDGDVIP